MTANSSQADFDARTMPGVGVWWGLIAAVAGASALAATVAAATGGQIAAGWHAGFLALASALLLPVPFHVLNRLHAERRVWVGRAAPLANWHAALRRSRRTLLLSWATAAVPLVLLRLLAQPPSEAWATAVLMAIFTTALLAAVLGLGLLAAAAWQGLLPWPLGAAAGVAALALLAYGGSGAVPEGLPAWAEQLGGTLQALLVGVLASLLAMGLAWQAVQLVHGKLDRPRNGPAGLPSPRQRLQAWRLQWAERWRRVDPAVNIGVLAGVMGQLPANMTNPNADVHYFQAWGSTVSPMHGLRLYLLTLVASLLLRGAAPHWRELLAPGSGFRRSVGLRVIGSTLATVLGQLLLVLAVGVAAVLLVPGLDWPSETSWTRLPGVVASYGVPLLADLVLAVALAAWLRGWLGSLGRVVGVVVGLGAAWVALVVLAAPMLGIEGFARSTLWSRGPGHLAGQLALAACFTLLAQRVWARVDLGAMARRPRSTPEDER
jgi:hypothetical protein